MNLEGSRRRSSHIGVSEPARRRIEKDRMPGGHGELLPGIHFPICWVEEEVRSAAGVPPPNELKSAVGERFAHGAGSRDQSVEIGALQNTAPADSRCRYPVGSLRSEVHGIAKRPKPGSAGLDVVEP